MKPCICGKSFNHSSSLSRHRATCNEYQDFKGQRRKEAIAEFHRLHGYSGGLAGYDPMAVPQFFYEDHEVQTFISKPQETTPSELVRLVKRAVRMIHLDPSRPNYWNVVLANKSTMRVLVYKSHTWTEMEFDDWMKEFARGILYCCLWRTRLMEDDRIVLLGKLMMKLDMDCTEALTAALRIELSDSFMRNNIKGIHKLR